MLNEEKKNKKKKNTKKKKKKKNADLVTINVAEVTLGCIASSASGMSSDAKELFRKTRQIATTNQNESAQVIMRRRKAYLRCSSAGRKRRIKFGTTRHE
jgi:hypothetical protein